MHINQLIYNKGQRIYNGETVSLMNCVIKTGWPHVKELSWTTILNHTQKSTQNGVKI